MENEKSSEELEKKETGAELKNNVTDVEPKNKQANGDLKKRKHPTFGQNLCDYFTEFGGYTGIHGIKYMGEQKKSVFERLFWLVVFVISLYGCIYLIFKTYEKWQSSPVIVSFARSPTPVWQVPFPAVTICSETKSRQTVFNFTDLYHKRETANVSMTPEELKNFERITLVCDNHLHPQGREFIEESTINYLSQVAPPFDEVFYECEWMNTVENCSKLFTPMLTEEGICFTFNMLDRDELFTNKMHYTGDYLLHGRKSTNWTLEEGYPRDSARETYPNRAISAGQGAGLSILMRAKEKDLDYICRGPVQGFKILLHHPAEVPRVSQQYFRAPLNQEVVVAIKPDMMTTSEGLREYEPHRRQCYFATERQLKFFGVYTQQNCDVECLANYTLNQCDCVSYHMPHEKDTKLCGAGKTVCVHQALVSLLTKSVKSSLEKFEESSSMGHQSDADCDCLPACTSLTYNSENSQADFDWPRYFQATKRDFSEFKGANMTRVTMFFKEMQFITSERNELYGPTDFLANCGGLLGLFTGFSFLSVVEIIYFLTFRLFCNIKKYGRHFWSGSEELIENDAYEHKH